ncbi:MULTISPECIES: GNAT family N-acetyltransferase [Dyella]|uniref:GNAT family N-acetyltransferase n=2 Tax=Dyella TaxID=231454 RepID=A0A4R0YNR2_9GAMM|nr:MULTISPECIES: GNAT family N-acetyltransferase [Dyella]TBR36758.1 GNAT family N-acetyltransferase [Dyella terrae]TCI08151.1 GNAT family N-acetyltransferase [Dyella soli]
MKHSKHSIRTALLSDHPELFRVWESAVRATHHFLAEEDIVFFRAMLPQAFSLLDVQMINDRDGALGFIGTHGHRIEALFVDPGHHGQGIGRQLLDHVIATAPGAAWEVDVNEQNPQAAGFYEHYGFRQVGRSALDSSGRPFPLLHLALKR